MLIIPRIVLVTTNVLYYRPDFPSIVNSFVWQTEDKLPSLPRVAKYLDFWRREIRAVIANIEVCYTDERGSVRRADGMWELH